jgi:DHA2 family multidrug resistance protein
VTPSNPAFQPMFASGTNRDTAALNASVAQQATTIAYLNDFKLMFAVAILLLIPLLRMIRPAQKTQDASTAHAAMN